MGKRWLQVHRRVHLRVMKLSFCGSALWTGKKGLRVHHPCPLKFAHYPLRRARKRRRGSGVAVPLEGNLGPQPAASRGLPHTW